MKTIRIDRTESCPEVILDKEKNDFTFTGKSLPLNAEVFYSPIFDWFDEYLNNPNNETTVIFDLEYKNSSSAKMIHVLLSKLKRAIDAGINITIVWLYEEDDEEQFEEGNNYAELLRLSIRMLSKQGNLV